MKTAIVGCGAIAQVHAACIQELHMSEFAGFADCKKDRAEAMASQYGGHAYASLEEMLDQEEIDVLHICTPHFLHVPMAIKALEHGVNVFSEKPPVISYEQLEQLKTVQNMNNHISEKLTDANKRSGNNKQINLKQNGSKDFSNDKRNELLSKERIPQLGFCFQNRYNPSIIKVKEMLASGEAGKILGARGLVTWMRDRKYYEDSDWRGKLATEGGGVLINQSIHTMDLLQYLIKEAPVSIHAVTTNHHLQGIMEEEDTMSAMIQYPDTRAIFYATSAYSSNPLPLIELECENMRIRIEGLDVTCYLPDGTERKLDIPQQKSLGKSYWGAGHRDCIKAYYESLLNHQPCPLNLTEVEPTIQLMLGAYESARINETIQL